MGMDVSFFRAIRITMVNTLEKQEINALKNRNWFPEIEKSSLNTCYLKPHVMEER